MPASAVDKPSCQGQSLLMPRQRNRPRTRDSPQDARAPPLDAHDAVVLGDHPSELGRGEPARVQPLQICVGRPTGDGAALSDVDGNAVLDELLQQLPQRRNADALEPVRLPRTTPSRRPPARPRIPALPPPSRWRRCGEAATPWSGRPHRRLPDRGSSCHEPTAPCQVLQGDWRERLSAGVVDLVRRVRML